MQQQMKRIHIVENVKPPRVVVEAIAMEHLGLSTLETRNSDRLDFSDQHVSSLVAAIEEAYKQGYAAAERGLTRRQ